MRIHFLLLLFLPILLWQCSKDDLRVAFEMTYPENQFSIPAGLNTIESHYVFLYDIPTRKDFFFNELEENQIQEIVPASARLRANDSFGDFSFAEEIVVRICEDNQVNINNVLDKCRREIFFRDAIPFNTGRQVNLIPNGNNLRAELTQESFTVAVVLLRTRAFTNVEIPSTLEMVFEAKR